MRYGMYRCVFDKQEKTDFVKSALGMMRKNGFSPIMPDCGFAEFVDNDKAVEAPCGEDELDRGITRVGDSFYITVWKEKTGLFMEFRTLDDMYDVVEIRFDPVGKDTLPPEECAELANGFSKALLESSPRPRGIIVDRRDILSDIVFDRYNITSRDNFTCLDAMPVFAYTDATLNPESPVREVLPEPETEIFAGMDGFGFDSGNMDNIFIYNFLPDGRIQREIFHI